jgi:hypothetical protein
MLRRQHRSTWRGNSSTLSKGARVAVRGFGGQALCREGGDSVQRATQGR